MKLKVKCNECNAVSINGTACHEKSCTSYLILTDSKKREYGKFKVYSLDVWGNKKDGFEVNDRSQSGKILTKLDDKSIIKALKKENFLNKKCHFKSFSIDGDDTFISIDAAKTGEPLYELERI